MWISLAIGHSHQTQRRPKSQPRNNWPSNSRCHAYLHCAECTKARTSDFATRISSFLLFPSPSCPSSDILKKFPTACEPRSRLRQSPISVEQRTRHCGRENCAVLKLLFLTRLLYSSSSCTGRVSSLSWYSFQICLKATNHSQSESNLPLFFMSNLICEWQHGLKGN